MRKKKTKQKKNTITKSVFLYGKPNKDKLAFLRDVENIYTKEVNRYIDLLFDNYDLLLPIVKNDKQDSSLRSFEKQTRKIKSAYSQNAFDEAVTKLSNRLNNIRLDMCSEAFDVFTKSKVLFVLSAQDKTKDEMIQTLEDIGTDFLKECAEALKLMSDEDFFNRQNEFAIQFDSLNYEYKKPVVKNSQVPVDSRIGVFEKSDNIVAPYVVTISHPVAHKIKVQIPVSTTANSIRRLNQYDKAGTFFFQIKKSSVKVSVSFNKDIVFNDYSKLEGVDVGITDALYTSSGNAIGSMQPVINFYKETVEPAFADLSDLRNKKRNIKHYLHTHNLPDDVRRSLIEKIDNLEKMIQQADAPYRKKRHYYQMLDYTIKQVVRNYIESIDKDTLTVLEKLDIREFNKSRKVNGMFSLFARGKLSNKLTESLNWYGYDFVEVEPAYTSQVCPKCFNLDNENRNGKKFKCTCCGHEDDADHNAAINIKVRFQDEALQEAIKDKFTHAQVTEALTSYYKTASASADK